MTRQEWKEEAKMVVDACIFATFIFLPCFAASMAFAVAAAFGVAYFLEWLWEVLC